MASWSNAEGARRLRYGPPRATRTGRILARLAVGTAGDESATRREIAYFFLFEMLSINHTVPVLRVLSAP